MTLLETLRSATRPLHGQLDRLLAGKSVTADRDAYTNYLVRFHHGVSLCWPALDWQRLADLGLPDCDQREERYHSLQKDLEKLGVAADPLPETRRSSIDPASITGCLYVLEGSIHGGAVLLGALRRTEPELAAAAAGFLHGFGEDNRDRWSSFMSWLSTRPADERSMNEAAAAASAAFGHFLSVFESDQPLLCNA